MRTLDPFEFWADRASAIAGYGGEIASPDPRYCFHTQYQSVRPGPAQFRLTLDGVEATHGELTLRVHGYRADGTQEAVLVAHSRLDFERIPNGDIALDVRFRAVRDINYAIYGIFTEPSDLRVVHVEVTLEELDDGADGKAFEEDVPTSALATVAVGSSASQSSALILGRNPSLRVPVSQDCTLRQLRSFEFEAESGAGISDDEAVLLWSEIACRQALIAYGAAVPEMRGLLVGGTSSLLSCFTQERGMTLRVVEWCPEQGLEALAADGHVDFLISFQDIASIETSDARYAAFAELLSRLLVGGIGLVCLRYDAATVMLSSETTRATQQLTRNEIGQWVLRLIGSGFSAAPLAFAPVSELVHDARGRAAILLVLRRL